MDNSRFRFRGRCIITGNWAYGYYYISKGNHIIRDENDNECIVLSNTVGQFSGLLDKNGIEIYEKDIFKHETLSPFHVSDKEPLVTEIGIVEWGVWSYMYGFKPNKPMFAFDRMKARQVEIIGNIFEHPNLLNPTK